MKKVLFGIFAHPDDESFGPSGTLIKMAQEGVNVHLMCLTRGEAGTNADNVENLAEVRTNEWHKAGQLMGASSMQQFDFGDGQLRGEIYHEVAEAIEAHITKTLASYHEPAEVEFLTFDTTGLTGHLDHIAASMIASYVFIRLSKMANPHQFTQLRYFCLPPTVFDRDVSFVYWPPGRNLEGIDEIIDVSDVFDQKLAVMSAHHSQRSDARMWLETLGDTMKREAFWFLK